ncbi:Prefoldin subunit 6 [Mycena venus]|uniref:Prefoldin subunit 6 n=1 Tax=Mycena venus TaxID=2733690 RepID=A0A8H7CRW0_9AGAR|nr:Prefoldin subunit 6 [Mycena venus]
MSLRILIPSVSMITDKERPESRDRGIPLPRRRSELRMSLQQRFETASKEHKKLQGDFSNAVEARQRLDAQLSENELVKKEFAQLSSDNIVYKQIGPVLVKQDQAEAKSNVETRLEFIKSEIKRVEAQLQDIQTKMDHKKTELAEIQAALQQAAQQASSPGAPLASVGA